jgi:hypothetical protein
LHETSESKYLDIPGFATQKNSEPSIKSRKDVETEPRLSR